MLAREFRLPGYKIPQVLKNGQSIFFQFFSIRFLENQQSGPQFCLIVSKKIMKKAVARNLIKRRIFSCLQQKIASFPQNYSFIFFIKKEIIGRQFVEIEKQIDEAIVIFNQTLSKNS